MSITFLSVSSSKTELSFKSGYRIWQPVGFPKKTNSLSSPKSITTQALFPTNSKDIVKYLSSFYKKGRNFFIPIKKILVKKIKINTSLLDNAPNYLVGCVIQQRFTISVIELPSYMAIGPKSSNTSI